MTTICIKLEIIIFFLLYDLVRILTYRENYRHLRNFDWKYWNLLLNCSKITRSKVVFQIFVLFHFKKARTNQSAISRKSAAVERCSTKKVFRKYALCNKVFYNSDQNLWQWPLKEFIFNKVSGVHYATLLNVTHLHRKFSSRFRKVQNSDLEITFHTKKYNLAYCKTWKEQNYNQGNIYVTTIPQQCKA